MNIVVVGGGTAGWISALFMRRKYPDAKVTLVHDNNTPIIGVGEGTTLPFMDLMSFIDIGVEDLIKNCEATIKHGIKFTNWNGDGGSYFHPFGVMGSNYLLNLLIRGNKLDEFALTSILATENKVYHNTQHTENTSALHFNARKLAEYLENVGIQRGIKIQIGKVQDVLLDDDEFVTELILDTKQTIKTDFVVDCTGFARLFVDKVYNTEMTYYHDILKTNRALPFFLEKEGLTPPYTEAICMKYGWMWKIPVGERYGCGYIFDSNFISDEDAYNEICEVTGQKPEIRKKISFKPGYHDKLLNKNTLSVGLSHGFLEPLEATSLFIACKSLLDLPDISERHSYTKCTTYYNEYIRDLVQDCVDMIHFHYFNSKREDTPFWKNYKKITNIPQHTRQKMKCIHGYKNINADEFTLFGIEDYLYCGHGDHIPHTFIDRNTTLIPNEYINKRVNQIREIVDTESISHDDYLKNNLNN
jgi:tryptophan halogenase